MPRPLSTEAGNLKTTSRSLSACEVARNLKTFDAWCSHHDCEQADISDLPSDLKDDVLSVFDFDNRIPESWLDDDNLDPGLMQFLRNIRAAAPNLFSSSSSDTSLPLVTSVWLAWSKLRDMCASGLKFSEADYAANVYNVFRSPAVQSCLLRTQCAISLPEPFRPPTTAVARRALIAKIAVPDGVVFIQPSSIRLLSNTVKSPWKMLNAHPSVSPSRRKPPPTKTKAPPTFRYQSTPCVQAPEHRGFEFASSFWEDKKSGHDMSDTALRQNRMATAASVRHLHSFQVQAPVFGLVWAKGRVVAHVDWWAHDRVLSARWSEEWNLEKQEDILRVFLLVRNIDKWTQTIFRDKVIRGVGDLLKSVKKGGSYQPWRRTEDAGLSSLDNDKENRDPPSQPSSKPKKKTVVVRK